eukprot:scaffold1517_cov397-Prasinococcus_capsulatus_cf.AAC.7
MVLRLTIQLAGDEGRQVSRYGDLGKLVEVRGHKGVVGTRLVQHLEELQTSCGQKERVRRAPAPVPLARKAGPKVHKEPMAFLREPMRALVPSDGWTRGFRRKSLLPLCAADVVVGRPNPGDAPGSILR